MFTGWTHEEGVPVPLEPGPPWPGWAGIGRRLASAGHQFGWPVAMALLALAVALLALGSGRYPLGPGAIVAWLAHLAGIAPLPPAQAELLHRVLLEIRLPRVAASLLVGAALSVSGAAFQSVFRNPLVSPDLLGVMAGASAGAAMGMLWPLPWPGVQALAFAGGLAAVALGVGIAQVFGGATVLMLVLGGIVSGAFFTALLSLAKVLADPYQQLPGIVYWLMGNLGQATLAQVALAAGPVAAIATALCVAGRRLDALAMGDDEAYSLGVPAGALRMAVIALATLACALTVSLAGMIGWVGLVVPHAARLLTGPGNGRLLPTAAFLGAALLCACDLLARNTLQADIPIGIVTQLLGIPLFLLVATRARRGWRE